MHTCKYCKKVFKDKETLKKHFGDRKGNRDLKLSCTECNLTMPCWGSYNTHIEAYHRNKHHKCPQCSLKFISLSVMKKHLRHKCTECPSTFCKNAALRKHLLTHSKRPYSCITCGSTFTNQWTLVQHTKTHETPEEGRHKCYICAALFSQKSYLEKHLLWKHDRILAKSYKCKVCSYSSDHLGNLRYHMSVHIADPNYRGNHSYTCISCSAEFQSRWILYYHALVVHENSSLKQCEACGKVVKKTAITAHSKYSCYVLRKKRKVLCIICNDQFENNKKMEVHIKENHGYAAFQIHQNLILQKPLSNSESVLLGKLTVINPILQSTTSSHTLCDNSGPSFQNENTLLKKSQITENPWMTNKDQLENAGFTVLGSVTYLKSEPSSQEKDAAGGNNNDTYPNQNNNHVSGNSKTMGHPLQDTCNDSKVEGAVKYLENGPLLQEKSVVEENKNGNFLEPPPTLESIDLDLSLLCNLLGNDSGTETRI